MKLKKRIMAFMLAMSMLAGTAPIEAKAACSHEQVFKSSTVSDCHGNYYLTSDVTLTSNIAPNFSYGAGAVELKICLNGHKLILNSKKIIVNQRMSVTICDCKGTGEIVVNNNVTNIEVNPGGFLNIEGGTINVENSSNSSGIIVVESNDSYKGELNYKRGTFNMTVSGASSYYAYGIVNDGGRVYISGGDFNVVCNGSKSYTGTTTQNLVYHSNGHTKITGGTFNCEVNLDQSAKGSMRAIGVWTSAGENNGYVDITGGTFNADNFGVSLSGQRCAIPVLAQGAKICLGKEPVINGVVGIFTLQNWPGNCLYASSGGAAYTGNTIYMDVVNTTYVNHTPIVYSVTEGVNDNKFQLYGNLASSRELVLYNNRLVVDSTISSNAHTWDESVVTKEATCLATGILTKTCSRCGSTSESAIAKTAHKIIYVEATEPSCSVEGYQEHYACSVCGAVYSDSEGSTEIAKEDITLEKKAHTFEWVVDKPATDDEAGLQHESCTVCGYVGNENVEIPKLEHTHDINVVAFKDATCSEEGNIEYYICSKCNKVYTEEDAVNEITLESTVIPVKENHETTKDWIVDQEAEKRYKICDYCETVYDEETYYFVDGEGTSEDPFQISTAKQLMRSQGYGSAHFILLNDIIIEDKEYEEGGLFYNYQGTFYGGNGEEGTLYKDYGWIPRAEFHGTFDGNGYAIKNLQMSHQYDSSNDMTGSWEGIYGFVGKNYGTIKNLALIDCDYVGHSYTTYNLGGIASYNYGTIENCFVSGTIHIDYAFGYGGGICAINEGKIKNCVNTAYVLVEKDGVNVGGICQSNRSNGIIDSCMNIGLVEGRLNNMMAYAAGLTSSNAGIITDSINYGPVMLNVSSADPIKLSGISTSNSGTIEDTYYYANNTFTGVTPWDESDITALNESNVDDQTYENLDMVNTWTLHEKYKVPVLKSNTFMAANMDLFNNLLDHPMNTVAEGHTYKSIKVSWDSVEGADGYLVYRALGSVWGYYYEFEPIKDVVGATSFIDDNGLKINDLTTRYYYKICPYFENENGVRSYGIYSGSASSGTMDTMTENLPDDTIAPVVNDIRVLTTEVTKPGVLKFEIAAEDPSGIDRVDVQLVCFNSNGSHNYIYGEYLKVVDGVVTMSITEPSADGIYYLDRIAISDPNSYYYSSQYVTATEIRNITVVDGKLYDNTPIKVSKEFDVEFEGVLSNKTIPANLEAMDEGKTMVLRFGSSNGVMSKEIQDAIAGKDKTVVVYCDEQGSIQWVFYGKDIIGETKDIDLNVNVSLVDGLEYGSNGQVIKLEFADNGVLPGSANFRLKSDYINAVYDTNNVLYLYYIDEEGSPKKEESKCTVIKDGSSYWCYVDLTHNSTFCLSGDELKKPITKYEAVLSNTEYEPDGTEKKPTVTIEGLTENTDFTVTYSNNIEPGIATVTITGIGEYTGTIQLTFEIIHRHDLQYFPERKATCLEDGNIEYYNCIKCGKYFLDILAAFETTIDNTVIKAVGSHDLEWIVDKEPSEENAGLQHEVCKVCGTVTNENVEIPKLEHTHDIIFVEAVDATCNKEGNIAYYICSKCNKCYVDDGAAEEITKESTIIPVKDKHETTKDWIVDQEAEKRYKICDYCEAIYDEETYYFVDGEGTADDPYQISTVRQLMHWQKYSNECFVLLNDIVIEDKEYDKDGLFYNYAGTFYTNFSQNGKEYMDYGWIPTSFSGVFDGNGYVIKNLKMSHSNKSDAGTYGFVKTNAGTIKNLGLIDCDFFIGGDFSSYIGGFAGYNYGKIENCFVSGCIDFEFNGKNAYVGGICGINYSGRIITNSVNAAKVTANCSDSYVGGICYRNSGVIDTCMNIGMVEYFTPNDLGRASGIALTNQAEGTIKNCVNLGPVINSSGTGFSLYIESVNHAGLVYDNYGKLEDCYYYMNNSAYGTGDREERDGIVALNSNNVGTQTYGNLDMEKEWTLHETYKVPILTSNTFVNANQDVLDNFLCSDVKLQAEGLTYKSIIVSWKEVKGAAGYRIYRQSTDIYNSTMMENYQFLAEVTDGTSFIDTEGIESSSLTKRYQYKICPYFENENGVRVYGYYGGWAIAGVVDAASDNVPEDCASPIVNDIHVITKDVVTKPGALKIAIDAEDASGIDYVNVTLVSYTVSGYSRYTVTGEKLKVIDGVVTMSIPKTAASSTYYLDRIEVYDPHSYLADTPPAATTIYNKTIVNGVLCDNTPIVIADEFKAELPGSLSSNKIVAMLEAMEEGEAAVLKFGTSGGIMKKEIQDAIAGQDKTIVVHCDEQGSMQWVFYGKDITGETKDLDLNVEISLVDGYEYGASGKLIKLVFADNGMLPGNANFRIKSDYVEAVYHTNNVLYLYYLNEDTGMKKEDSECTVIKDGSSYWCYVDLTHNSTFFLAGEELKTSISSKNVVLSQTEFEADGTEKRPTVTIEGLKEGVDYTLAYSNNIEAGTATVTITGIGEYAGTKTVTFNITAHTHQMNYTPEVPATCGAPGKIAYYQCGLCGKYYSDENGMAEADPNVEIPATGMHTFEWFVDKEATEDETGLKHEECIVCKFTQNETVIPKLEGILGDVNGDQTIDTSDAQAIFNYFMGISIIEDETLLKLADVNKDGSIDTSDAQMVFNMFMGIM